MNGPVIGYVGMTHLGLMSAIAAAEKGCTVICLDTDASLIGRLRTGNLPVTEPQSLELLNRNRGRLSFTADAEALAQCDIVYIAPDVATDDTGASDLSAIDALLDLAATRARADAVLVVLSQVPPGYTRAHDGPGRRLFYQVETLVFGRAIERALYPERFIIGASDAGAPLPGVYRDFLELFGCPRLVMRYESAELAKISINCCLVASISTTNTLAELCERIGADWNEIAPALKLDARIGAHAYLTPGLGIAGGNLERDLATVLRFADAHGTDAGVVSAWIANSRHRKDWPYRTLRARLLDAKPRAHVAVLGLAYKENTHSIKNSPALALLARLSGARVTVYDPVVSADVAPTANPAVDMVAAVQGVDALAIMTPWPVFRDLEPARLARDMAGRLVLDPYRVLDPRAARAAGLDYQTLGVSTTVQDEVGE